MRAAAGVDLDARLAEWCARLAEVEPEVRALVDEPDREARVAEEARRLGATLAEVPANPSQEPPALAGLLLGVKDIFHVGGLTTRAGSRLPVGELAGEEAEAVTRLRAAGAIVIGKTVTTEFAYFSPGPTRNPRALAHTPGGSSSGSAAAVAAELCDLALGTQTIGSVGRPAAFCGVVGFKPSYERVSRSGVIPLVPSLDHVGLFARDVATIARAMPVLADRWEKLAAGEPRRERPRLGVPTGPYLDRMSAEGARHFAGVRRALVDAGWEVVELPAMTDFSDIDARHHLLVAADAAAVHADWFARFGELYAAKTAELVRRGQSVGAVELDRTRAGRDRLRDELHDTMERHEIDLWLSPPAVGPAPRGLESTGDPVMNLPWTHAGLPTLVVPAGVGESDLPMGAQLAARFGADAELLAWGEAIATALAAPEAQKHAEREER